MVFLAKTSGKGKKLGVRGVIVVGILTTAMLMVGVLVTGVLMVAELCPIQCCTRDGAPTKDEDDPHHIGTDAVPKELPGLLGVLTLPFQPVWVCALTLSWHGLVTRSISASELAIMI